MPDIALDLILPNPEQPRQFFAPEELEELAASIRENGVIQPIVVEPVGVDHEEYFILDGERRVRAARLAGLREIPAVINGNGLLVRSPNGKAAQELLVRALVANIQRSNLTPMEEARAFARLRDEQGMKTADIARKLGKSQAFIVNRLFLLELDKPIQDLVAQGALPSDVRVAKALLAISDQAARLKLAHSAAVRRSSIQTICVAARKVSTALKDDTSPSDHPPAVRQAFKRVARPFNASRWNALRQIGQAPPWEVVVGAADQTCRACLLQSAASEEVCRDCPLPTALKNMIEASHDRPNRP